MLTVLLMFSVMLNFVTGSYVFREYRKRTCRYILKCNIVIFDGTCPTNVVGFIKDTMRSKCWVKDIYYLGVDHYNFYVLSNDLCKLQEFKEEYEKIETVSNENGIMDVEFKFSEIIPAEQEYYRFY